MMQHRNQSKLRVKDRPLDRPDRSNSASDMCLLVIQRGREINLCLGWTFSSTSQDYNLSTRIRFLFTDRCAYF